MGISGVILPSSTLQGTKLTFFSRRHLATKFPEVVAKPKKLVANLFFRKQQQQKKLYKKCIVY